MDGTAAITALNTWGATGLLERTDTRGNVWYQFDAQGNVSQRLADNGTILSSDLYDSFGNLLLGGDSSDPYGYHGQAGYYFDHETGLMLCTHRYYDPTVGRWINRDPIGYEGGINIYGYCGNNPVNGLDTEGFVNMVHAYIDSDWFQQVEDYRDAMNDALTARNAAIEKLTTRVCSASTRVNPSVLQILRIYYQGIKINKEYNEQCSAIRRIHSKGHLYFVLLVEHSLAWMNDPNRMIDADKHWWQDPLYQSNTTSFAGSDGLDE